jgi:hypothetical protein
MGRYRNFHTELLRASQNSRLCTSMVWEHPGMAGISNFSYPSWRWVLRKETGNWDTFLGGRRENSARSSF